VLTTITCWTNQIKILSHACICCLSFIICLEHKRWEINLLFFFSLKIYEIFISIWMRKITIKFIGWITSSNW
jgi:hypothetical protein